MVNQYGFFVTKSGKNVLQKQNLLDYIINSNYNTFKIYKEINGSILTSGTSTIAKVIAHGLGYHPAFLAYYRLKAATSVWFSDQTSLNSTDDPDNDGYRVGGTQINKSEIRFSASDAESKGASNIEFKAFLLVDPISLVPPGTTGVPLSNGFGFKASKPNIDVTKAKAHELLLSSKYDSLKFHMEKTVSFTITNPGTSGSASFEHGLGYVPMFLGVIQDYNDTTKQRIAPFGRVPQDVATSVKANRSTITAVALQIAAAPTTTYTFRLIVFKNRLSVA